MNADILKLLGILLKHTGEIPNVVSKFQAAVTAITTHGAEKIDPLCDLLNAFKPLEADAIAGGFLAAHTSEQEVAEKFGKIGDGTLLKQFLELLNSPAAAALLPLILKVLGVG